jgi:hypothetical protein
MNYYEKPTMQQEQAAAEIKTVFSKHMSQFKEACDVLRDIESNLSAIANDALKAALLSPGHVIQTDDGAEWRHDVDLSKITSTCHRRTATGMEFAVVECLSLKNGEMKDVLNSGHNLREVLQEFMRDQRQVLNLWKTDVTAGMREHLDEKYPGQNMDVVVESFEYKLSRAISETRAVAQSQSHGVRI